MVSKEQIDDAIATAREFADDAGDAGLLPLAIKRLAGENDSLRADFAIAEDALKLAREVHQVTIDEENRLRAQLAEAVALIERAPIGGTDDEIIEFVRDRREFAKLRGTL